MIAKAQDQLIGCLSIIRLKHAVIGGPERMDHHVQQFRLFVGHDYMSPCVEGWWWGRHINLWTRRRRPDLAGRVERAIRI